ncbi:MAG: hypothetical protein K2G25_09395, partial [Oscillospiraceae bacterium]|nr:hypothetical protein [Oscillospiraceae bacterium]
NADTIEFAKNFPKETRAIWYANDDSRNYVREKTAQGISSKLADDATTTAISKVDIAVNSARKNEVTLTITPNDTVPADDILGYEITRCTISAGKTEKSVIGFTQTTNFTDIITSLNNRAVSYEVTMIDKYLNRSAVKASEMTKIQHTGAIGKSRFQISTTGLQATAITQEIEMDEKDHSKCDQGHIAIDPPTLAIDDDYTTTYEPQVTGTVTGNNTKSMGEIVLNFNETLTVQGLEYTGITSDSPVEYKIYVREKGANDFSEKPVATGTFKNSTDSEIIYFAFESQKYVNAYTANAVKIELITNKNAKISIAELNVLAPTGDNVEFRTTENEGTVLIGTLGENYVYDETNGYEIPAGSLVFTGEYKGNPAYNVIMLFDENGQLVGGTDEKGNKAADQILLADVPEGGKITDVGKGTWIYWIEPDWMGEGKMTTPKQVRVELYRVDNALTNAGQRLVSDSLFETVPEELPTITFGK